MELPEELRQWTWEEATECHGGCTLTQGYWKNHSKYAKTEAQRIPWPKMIRPGDEKGEDNTFCGVTWWELMQRKPVGGDAYIILAHQWIAARLNVAADTGPDACHPPLVTWALTRGEELLKGCTIAPEDRDRALRLAGWLEMFNEGSIGPGHCDDQCDDRDGKYHDGKYHYGTFGSWGSWGGHDPEPRKHGECKNDPPGHHYDRCDHRSHDHDSKDHRSKDGRSKDHRSKDGGSRDHDRKDGHSRDHDSDGWKKRNGDSWH